MLKLDQRTLTKQVEDVISRFHNIGHDHPFAVLSHLCTLKNKFEHTIDLLNTTGSKSIDFDNQQLISQLVQAPTKPILPDHPDVFVDFELTKTSDIHSLLHHVESTKEIIEGEGALKQNSSIDIEENTFYTAALGVNNLSFEATKEGSVTVQITVKDSNNIEHTTNIVFSVSNVDFDFNASLDSNNITIVENSKINFSVLPDANINELSFQMKYESTGEGAIKDSNNNVLTKGVYFVILSNNQSNSTQKIVIK